MPGSILVRAWERRRTYIHAHWILLIEGEYVLSICEIARPWRCEFRSEIAPPNAPDWRLDRARLVARVLLGNWVVDADITDVALSEMVVKRYVLGVGAWHYRLAEHRSEGYPVGRGEQPNAALP